MMVTELNMTYLEFDLDKRESSLISHIKYDYDNKELYLEFHTWLKTVTYIHFPVEALNDFLESGSFGKFYLENIKGFFKIKKQNNMADKIIKLKIDVTKLKKEWFFKGEKGIYADITILYNEKQDAYGNNGLIIQDVPKQVYKDDKNIKGPIVGNCKDWATEERPKEAMPGQESGKMGGDKVEEFQDDLPF